ncbi:MAG: hypothetical protein JNM41_02300 [Flavipsychrobacter sp.]|jgi:hypothetical protein|nr:hypothetical protein [Chitinophagaceae bacterium]MBL7690398.1 hypothetical protein [Flavipsychrobacter sp.]
MNTNQENAELLDKIAEGLKLAIRKLYEKKAANNELAVIADDDGQIKWLPARELLERQKNKK